MMLSAKTVFQVAALAALALTPSGMAQGQAGGQTNGIASPLQHVSPTGAVTIPQAEVPSVSNLDAVQPHLIFVNRGNGHDGTRIFYRDTSQMHGIGHM